MNNIIKGIKLILNGLLSPFKTIAHNIYMFVGKKYYWVPILVKIEQLEKENKLLNSSLNKLRRDSKEKIKELELRVVELEPKYEVKFKSIKGDK